MKRAIPFVAVTALAGLALAGHRAPAPSPRATPVQPVVYNFTPLQVAPGQTLTINGVGLAGATNVNFTGGPSVTPTNVTDTSLTVVVPAGAVTGNSNSVQLPVTGVGLPGRLQILAASPPTITNVQPMPIGGGGAGSFQITGTGFSGATEVLMNNVPCLYVNIQSDTAITASAPSVVGSATITVKNNMGAATSQMVNVLAPPLVTATTPLTAQAGTLVSIQGEHLSPITSVQLSSSGQQVPFTLVSDNLINLTFPAGAASTAFSMSGPSGFVSSTEITRLDEVAPTLDPITAMPAANQYVSVTGKALGGTISVTMNGEPLSFGAGSDTQLNVQMPADQPSGTLTVTNNIGSATSSMITIQPPLTITGFSPMSGKVGDTVTFTGTGMQGVTYVYFGNGYATPSSVSATSVSAVVPGNATSAPIYMGGSSGAGQTQQTFTVLGTTAPMVAGVSTMSASWNGQVQITGTGFIGTSSVTMDGLKTSYYLGSDTQLQVNVPAGAHSAPIVITNNVGTAMTPMITIVAPPHLDTISPSIAQVGQPLTLTGAGFTGTTNVSIGGSNEPFTIMNDNTIVVTPTIFGQGGYVAVQSPFSYVQSGTPVPLGGEAVSMQSPQPARGGSGTQLSVQGQGMYDVTDVQLDGKSLPDWYPSGDQYLIASIPPDATTGPITLVSPSGTATSIDPFQIAPPPRVTSISPTSGKVGDQVTITGVNLLSPTVSFFNQSARVVAATPSSVTVVIPIGAQSGPLRVFAAGGQALSDQPFTVQGSAVPHITAVYPQQGASAGAFVQLQGSGFTGATGVAVNGTAAQRFFPLSDTFLIFFLPSGASTGPVTVTNAAGTGTSPQPLTVYPPPTVTGISPSSGAPGDTITITGTGLTNVNSVQFGNSPFGGGSPAVIPNVMSDTMITAAVPPGALSGPVILTNTYGGTVSTTQAFTAKSGGMPTIAGFAPATAGVGMFLDVHGMNFTGTTAVTVNGTPAQFNLVSDFELRVVTPMTSPGPIAVTTDAGTATSATPVQIAPTSNAPQVTSIEPAGAGPGARVTINGHHLSFASLIWPGPPQQTFFFANTQLDYEDHIVAIVPQNVQTGQLLVIDQRGAATSPPFVVGGPVVSGFNPTMGSAGDKVTVMGSSFTDATAVTFNGVYAATFSVDNDGQITVTVPVGASTGKIAVIGPAGTGTSSMDFTVINSGLPDGGNGGGNGKGCSCELGGASSPGGMLAVFAIALLGIAIGRARRRGREKL